VGGAYIPSPNCDDRPPLPIPPPQEGEGEFDSLRELDVSGVIELLVIHNISLPPGEFGSDDISRLFTNTLDAHAHPYYQRIAGLRVSAHFLVRRDGRIIQFVPCLKRAWHAGESCWQGRMRCNDFSVGIELEGSDTVPFTDAQYEALHHLTLALRAAYPLRGIAGHSDIAPQRKTDPGRCFDWLRYLAGLSG